MTSERNDPPEEKKEKKQKRLIIILIILLLIALLFCGVFAGYIIYNEFFKEDPGMGGTGGSGVTLKDTESIEQKQLPNIAIPGWTELTIPANTVKLNDIPFYNPKENKGNYDLTFEVRLLDDRGRVSSVLFTTGLIPAGKEVATVTLSKGLSPGVYDAVLHVQPYYVEDGNPTNNMETALRLTVV